MRKKIIQQEELPSSTFSTQPTKSSAGKNSKGQKTLELEKKINPSNVAVKNYLENMPTLYSDLKDKSSKFKAGKVASY